MGEILNATVIKDVRNNMLNSKFLNLSFVSCEIIYIKAMIVSNTAEPIIIFNGILAMRSIIP